MEYQKNRMMYRKGTLENRISKKWNIKKWNIKKWNIKKIEYQKN